MANSPLTAGCMNPAIALTLETATTPDTPVTIGNDTNITMTLGLHSP